MPHPYDTSMTNLDMPAPVANYFRHQPVDSQALAACFTEHGSVRDDGHEHRGRAAIAAWNADVIARYADVTTELVASTTSGETTTVTVQASGTFPGSPIRFRFVFELASELIARLDVRA